MEVHARGCGKFKLIIKAPENKFVYGSEYLEFDKPAYLVFICILSRTLNVICLHLKP